jgi:hypothetical protein
MRFFIPNFHFYQTDRFPGKKGVPHNHADLHYMCDYIHLTKAKPINRDKPILSSEMLHKDYECKGSAAKKKKTVNLKGLGAKTK